MRMIVALMAASIFGCSGGAKPTAKTLAETATNPGALQSGSLANVPADFVRTPNGFFHPSCIIALEKGEKVQSNGKLARADGRERTPAPCQYASYDKQGQMIAAPAGEPPPPTINGWLASAQSTEVAAVRSLRADWIVPNPPAISTHQIVYFFPGLQPLGANPGTILQPVLGWNHINEGQRWTIASWNCCVQGNVFHSALIPVNPGDQIAGEINGINCNPQTGTCNNWIIDSTNNGADNTRLETTSYGQVLNWEFAGVLEPYAIDTCGQLPSDGSIDFNNIELINMAGDDIIPAWRPVVDANARPGCSLAVGSSGRSAGIRWYADGCVGPFFTHGAIADKYFSLSGCRGFLGSPTTDETGTPDGVGRFNHFQNHGSIYYSPASGVHFVQGSIHDKWAALGFEQSALGYPTTDELTPPDQVGRLSHFQNGAIYFHPALGAFEVRGAIYALWSSLGYEQSALGYPTTDELGTPDGVGRFNHFQNNGSIYYSPASGTHFVQGSIHAKWAALGFEQSALGYPTSDELTPPDHVGRLNHFQNGAIYAHPSIGAFAVQGEIYNGWAAMGYERSTFGYPTSDEFSVPIGRRSNFQDGAIVWVAATGGLQFCGSPSLGACRPDQGG